MFELEKLVSESEWLVSELEKLVSELRPVSIRFMNRRNDSDRDSFASEVKDV